MNWFGGGVADCKHYWVVIETFEAEVCDYCGSIR